jgi:RNA polymerase subunit RPABC4/transcription elongation factor Spt4
MLTSHGRYCRRCRNRISRRISRCPICGAINLKARDYLMILLLLAAAMFAAWRWL